MIPVTVRVTVRAVVSRDPTVQAEPARGRDGHRDLELMRRGWSAGSDPATSRALLRSTSR